MNGIEITDDLRPWWQEQRKLSIGASEAAGALGLSPYESQTPLAIYALKAGLREPDEPSIRMRMGILAEPEIARLYQEETGCVFTREQSFYQTPFIQYNVPLSATLDRETEDKVVELKSMGWRSAKGGLGSKGTDEVPDHWLVQVQIQMALANKQHADIAVLVDGEAFRIYPVEFDHHTFCRIVDGLARFWQAVQTKTPPEPTSHADAKFVPLVNPDCQGEINLDYDSEEIATEYSRLTSAINLYEKSRGLIKAQLDLIMGNAAIGLLPDGRAVKRSITNVRASTKTANRKAYSYSKITIIGGDNGDEGQE